MSGIEVTERAARRINEIMTGEPAGSMLRVSVNGGGCSGFSYAFDVDRTRGEDDLVIERDGAAVLVDPVSLQYMDGSRIDFVDDLIGQSF
ncbi:MAG TPA: iron-sulfur cluster assembly accessory protein, partial [Salinarimonas sp.]|nr:iron-sulfur cluster assembly accessory protein [Salinarimonas sp.]